MKRNKTQKGITLVALIITIIVLLILAVVAIRAVQGDGIIAHARNARDDYNQAQIKENGVLQGYEDYITGQLGNGEQVTKGNWTQNKTEVKNSKTNQILEVGQVVKNYSETNYSGEWVVLGVENGNLLLTTKTNVTTLTLQGREAYNTGVEQLTATCGNYGKGTGSAGIARSIKIEDLNRVTGYNVETADAATKQIFGTLSKYGKTITFFLAEDGKIMYSEEGQGIIDSGCQYFFHPDGRVFTKLTEAELTAKGITGYTTIVNTSGEITKINNNGYMYYPETLTLLELEEGETAAGISKDSLAYQNLMGTDSEGTDAYWLASLCTYIDSDDGKGVAASFGCSMAGANTIMAFARFVGFSR